MARLNDTISVKLVYKRMVQKLRAHRALEKVLIEENSLVELMEAARPAIPELPPPSVRPRGQAEEEGAAALLNARHGS